MYRIEPVPFRDTEAADSACVYTLQIRTRDYGCARIKTRTVSFVWSDVFVPPIVAQEESLGEYIEHIEYEEWIVGWRSPEIGIGIGVCPAAATPNFNNGPLHSIVFPQGTTGSSFGIC